MDLEKWQDFAWLMVKTQIESRGVEDERVLQAMKKVPRHLFVAEEYQSLAYVDAPLPIGESQTISQPYMVALMTELLQVSPGMKILEIGTGSGYQAAVLAEIGAKVFSIERISSLAKKARNVLSKAGYEVVVVTADGREGYAQEAPYNGIIVTAAADRVEEAWRDQLSIGGRLVVPLSVDVGLQRLVVLLKKKNQWIDTWHDYCRFVPVMPGTRTEKREGADG
ncbi:MULTISPECIES: protein-L-isoaspartate(D-aspartate) O-methyltransferase [Aminobacterium]|jgi:protein-L-isoaspartate(D-aspartate) O-methyltransferase|uniref:Protein-L-isoaspartate O-methyltransferase n=1 Tax=Aminobacterium colombiense (strain DSM 12261 / ALA-1) TaxID=572547 RepID=D5ED42_AMICL|nr:MULTISPECIES: protein-L-isoaspartate(D-aspartate) O-methyltransferase [Aminobacterium]MDD2378786.1 protein-L-isoaspartate(D-aspartate) O-methyltransferase [Aminobacterium colombiense]ADE56474.1 protein-L-isoaspartate O-methyltransferase [Aminobacterium colombiense DSM 12261]MDD3767334.1 protein-L-isoaspartate(D-aspartate) O-methyltransferase [Aminobacterium colombiense]MDD4265145.1 protein-L-isoaspartate(D-aspartate) O-methyltransferase [Aminobacterium colombiense]MDD4585351.1 protein-L-iso